MKKAAVPQIEIVDYMDENDEDLMEAFDFDNLNEDESLVDVNINDMTEIFTGSLEERLRRRIKKLQDLRNSHMRKICTLQRLIGRLKKRNADLMGAVKAAKAAKLAKKGTRSVAVNTTDDVFFLM